MTTPKFTSVDEMIDFLPEEEREVTLWLRRIILEAVPQVHERLSYNVAFYRLRKNLCYLWPGSVLWGEKRTYEGVRMGFVSGHLLTDPERLLQRGDRKYVHWIELHQVGEVDDAVLKAWLFEAALLDGSS